MIAIIDYGAGNIASVRNALQRISAECSVTRDPGKILSADGVIFPGQGRAGAAMRELRQKGIDRAIRRIKKPFLGICLGMQLLCRYSEEDNVKCLGIFPGKCRRFPPTLKTPHLGWNRVNFTRKSPLSFRIPDGSCFYFAHSYYIDADTHVIAQAGYGFDFPAIMQKNNFFAVQFHPEKSGTKGTQLLRNFLKLCS